MENNIKAVAYFRVSSREQEDGFSLIAQENLIDEYTERKNIILIKKFKEAETAKSSGRTEFNKMISFLKENPEIKNVCVEKTDRLYRNFKDYLIIDDLNLIIHFVKEGGTLRRVSIAITIALTTKGFVLRKVLEKKNLKKCLLRYLRELNWIKKRLSG